MSSATYEAWFSFDFELDDGRHVVDELFEQADLTRGERSFLEGSVLRPSGVSYAATSSRLAACAAGCAA